VRQEIVYLISRGSWHIPSGRTILSRDACTGDDLAGVTEVVFGLFLVFSLEFKEDTAIGGQLADLLFSMTAS
jgi:hypothetical protein